VLVLLGSNMTHLTLTAALLSVAACALLLSADLQVQQAFTLMNASLNAFLAAVPVKYQRYRI
jgi:hypothetical protein